MTWQLILTVISFLIFIVYNVCILTIFDPINVWSMSRSYYLFEDIKKGLGWVFTGFMLVMAFTLMPGWFDVSEAMGPWMSYFTFLAFIAAASIAFVGIAPRYYNEFEGKIHMTAAKASAATALAWCFIVCWPIWYVPLIGCAIAALIGLCFEDGWKECAAYWLEMMAFDATFGTIITALLLKQYGLL